MDSFALNCIFRVEESRVGHVHKLIEELCFTQLELLRFSQFNFQFDKIYQKYSSRK